jgi:two-component system, response regulator
MNENQNEALPLIEEILLIEDNPDDRVLIERALRKNKAAKTIMTACDGAEALDYLFGLESFSGRDTRHMPELIVLDLKIPKIDGLGVLETVRTNACTRSIPVVILTSSEQDRDLVESYQLGANCYLRKNVDFVGFCETVHQLLPQLQELVRKRAAEKQSRETKGGDSAATDTRRDTKTGTETSS